MLSPQEAQVVLEFLNRVSVQGLQEATNLAAVAQKVTMIAQRHPDEPGHSDIDPGILSDVTSQ